MPLKNTQNSFGHLARSFHWLSALLVLGLLSVGFIMVDMPFSPEKLELYGLHKSFGMIVLGLTLLRIMWKVISTSVNHLPTHTPIERLLAQTIHIVLYISLLGMPLSGLIMSNAGEFPNSFFGLFEFPALTEKNEALYKGSKLAHELFAFAFIGAIGLHLLGALKHHVIDKDETLRRMGGNLFVAALGGLLLLSATYFAGEELLEKLEKNQKPAIEQTTSAQPEANPADSEVTQWAIDPAQSAINFTFTQYGQDISGHFDEWNGDIHFDPESLDQSHVQISINIASIKTGSTDRDEQAISDEWFAAQTHPRAIFKSESFEALEEQKYSVKGHLTLRGITLPVEFPFTLNISENRADMSATLTLKRLDFGVGQGQWEETDAIGNDVQITLKTLADKHEK